MVPGPTNVPERVRQAMMKPIISHRGPEFRSLYKGIIENLKYLFQTEGDVFVHSVSGTGGVDCMISNVVSPGDKVLIPVFGLFSERMREKIIRRGGIPVEVRLKYGEGPTAEEISRSLDREKDVRIIAIVYNETSTGVTVRDLPAIGKIAKERDALLLVDAVSILGGDKLPVDDWNIDICVAGSQKCLACPPGLSVISVSEYAWKKIEETSMKPYYHDLTIMRKFQTRYETPFTPSIPLFYALDESLKMIREEGLENRFMRHKVCSEAFYSAVEAMGLEAFPEREFRSNTVIAIKKPKNVNVEDVRRIMREKYRVVIAGGAGKVKDEIFRIGCMGVISAYETLVTIDALEKSLNAVGFPVEIGTGTVAARRSLKRFFRL
ncbi:alanine--glyoxylate aminotransferase family protein [Candidatus Bathyarchaeota archaeon]|nr:MAG: alanine--glyoxylate aminotransferase family protein [Candidatus Bathyarchaeota archaeon]